MFQQNTKKKSLSDKISETIIKQNRDQSSTDEDSEPEDIIPKVVDFEEEYDLPEAKSSDIRKRNVKLLSEQSERYRGRLSSRQDFEKKESSVESDSEGEKENSDDRETDSDSFEMQQENEDSSDEGSANSDDSDSEESNESDSNDSKDDETRIIAEKNQEAEIRKGKCVKNQLIIWEKLLETRIHSQKVVNNVNLLPPPNELKKQISEDKTLATALRETSEGVGYLLSRLLSLQSTLTNQFPEFKESCKRSVSPFDSKSNLDSRVNKMGLQIADHFSVFKPCRDSILLKWDDRTRLLTPGAATKRKFQGEDHDVIHKINNALLNRSSLIEKTQILKGSQQASSNDADNNDDEIKTKQINPNIYDDTDFYHQQLRELIEFKSLSSTNASEVAKQLIELQKVRQKMKKKVDTRCSKGRKIRYTVHNKLINFMAPHDTSHWTNESKNELYKSLFAL